MCDTVARSLYAAGYEVDTCYDGARLWNASWTENYDLIVLDLNLTRHGRNGSLKELRKETKKRRC